MCDLIWGCGGVAATALASHHGEPSSIPGGTAPRFPRMVIVLDNAAGRWVFPGISFFTALAFLRCSILTSLHPVGFQDLVIQSRRNLFTSLHGLMCYLSLLSTYDLVGSSLRIMKNVYKVEKRRHVRMPLFLRGLCSCVSKVKNGAAFFITAVHAAQRETVLVPIGESRKLCRPGVEVVIAVLHTEQPTVLNMARESCSCKIAQIAATDT
ncbi:hypothetical protein PR048_002826 [Dryococelus australis]|uniref:Uncharacterized protein n=1 Tax=Dryococelus australis TaxID=614101 RepID=A0ABQ9ILF6_9NEOP|nr:hypothetical protein PR048_002826 [Dryococelus australis]